MRDDFLRSYAPRFDLNCCLGDKMSNYLIKFSSYSGIHLLAKTEIETEREAARSCCNVGEEFIGKVAGVT